MAEPQPAAGTTDVAMLEAMNPTPAASAGRGDRKRPRRPAYIEKFIDQQFNTRPGSAENKQGLIGSPVNLSCNYIKVDLESADAVTQYQVDFEPALPLRNQKFAVIRNWARKNHFESSNYVYDGGSALYAHQNDKFPVEDTTEIIPFEGRDIKLRVYKVASLDKENPQMMVLLNTQLTRFQEKDLSLIRVNEACFDPKQAKTLTQEGIEIWPGFSTAIGVFENHTLLMSVDQRFRIIRTENAMEVVKKRFTELRGRNMSMEDCQKEAAKAVIGSTIETLYNNKIYRIQGVNWGKSPESTFTIRDRISGVEREEKFSDYFKRQYAIQNIRDPMQPLLVARPTNRATRRKGNEEILLIPELCRMTGYTDKMRQNFQTMKAISAHTKLEPSARKGGAAQFVNKINSNDGISKQLDQWRVTYGKNLIDLKGRSLGVQPLHAGQATLHYEIQKTDWTQSLRGQRLEEPKKIDKWLVLYTKADETATRHFCETMTKVGEPMGVKFATPRAILVAEDTPQAFVNKCIENRVDQGCQMVFAVFPRNSKDLYDAFKKLLCCTNPCVSQVVTSKNANHKSVMSVATKVVMQINAKFNGQLWRCNLPFKEPTMVIGVDTQRDRQARHIVVTGCATTHKHYGQYVSFTVDCQEDEEVMKTAVPSVIKQCTEGFKAKCGVYPQRVIIYRDGITEGQFRNMHNIELKEVQSVLQSFATQSPVQLTYVLVNKRESTRLFLEMGPKGPQANPVSGTVVDHTITRPSRYDFYLVSQSVREGTVAPTYYNCIHDGNQLSPDHLQQITYLLTHMYFNWPGTVRVPAPVQMARKLGQLRAQNLHERHHEKMNGYQFYL